MFKIFTIRMKLPLYNRLRVYKEDNGFPSIAATIMYIINQFFKNPI